MAHIRTLSENWTLAGGVFDPFPIERPMDVRRALTLQGLLKPRAQGLEMLAEEWIYRCRWTYETVFSWTDEDERCQLECEFSPGACAVTVNGARVADGYRPGEAALDISHALVEGENRLALSFPPPGPQDAPPCLGLAGRVALRTGNGMALDSFDAIGAAGATGDDGRITARTALCVYASGRYVFRYVVALGDAAAYDYSFTEALRPGPANIAHELPVQNPARFDPERPDDTLYTVRMSIERLGVGCQLAFGRAYFEGPGAAAPAKVCAVPKWIAREELEARLPLLKQLGVDGLFMPGREQIALASGFWPAEPDGDVCRIGAFATLEPDGMHELALGEKYWPPGGPVWRLTSSRWPDDLDLEALLGPNAMGDAGRAARVTRFLQAERVRLDAYRARIAGKPACIDWPFEASARYGSYALVEFGGGARAAYDALEEAWKPVAVCAGLPEDMRAHPGERIRVGAWLLSPAHARGAVTVDIACHSPDGSLLGATSLPGMLGAGARVGELVVTMPGTEGVVLVRVRALRGEDVAAQSDWTLCVTENEAPLHPLMGLKAARLTQKDGRLVNEGESAALAVCSLGYRTLLPGEHMRCADTYECLNGLV